MTDHSPSPGTSIPGRLLLRAPGACHFDPPHLIDVFGEQRQRFVAVLQGFGADDWAVPTRCADWSAHERRPPRVRRHRVRERRRCR